MPLDLQLKPFQRFHVGRATVTNWSEASSVSIEGSAPILRHSLSLLEDQADTLLKQVYLALQKVYLQTEDASLADYCRKSERLLSEMPDAAATLEATNGLIADGNYFKALRALSKVVTFPAIDTEAIQEKFRMTPGRQRYFETRKEGHTEVADQQLPPAADGSPERRG